MIQYKYNKNSEIDKQIDGEINILKILNNENILKYYEHYEDNGFLCLITEYCQV